MEWLYRIGSNVKLIHWLSSYLINRNQRVVIGGKFSKIMTLLAGVPQCSILGLLLFLLFINHLEVTLESDINLSFSSMYIRMLYLRNNFKFRFEQNSKLDSQMASRI